MGAVKKSQLWWVLVNLLGIGAFLAFASKAWIEPELADMPGASVGDFIVWGAFALPFLVVFFLLHFSAAATALYRKRADWALPIILTAVFWIAAAAYDNAHHGI